MILRELVAMAVESAKRLYAELGLSAGDVIPLETIKVRVDAADTVLVVWCDPAEQDGTGWRQIKGPAALRTGHIGKLQGILCAGPAEAEALFREFGDRDPWDAAAH
jgi:hypothetical protein